MTPLCRESLGKPKGNVFARLQATAGAALPMPAGELAALVLLVNMKTRGKGLSCVDVQHMLWLEKAEHLLTLDACV